MEKIEPRTAEIRVMVQPWQMARIKALAEAVGTTAERIARILVLGGLLTDEPVAQVAIALERIGRHAVKTAAETEMVEREDDDELVPLMVSRGTVTYLRELAEHNTRGNVSLLVELMTKHADPYTLRVEVDTDRLCGRLVAS
jgi:hypothetical protein